MNVLLWIVTGLLATGFSIASFTKTFVAREKLAASPGGAWVMDFSRASLRMIAAVEILGVLGLILPAAFDIATVLVPIAAVGLALVMVGAISMRLRWHERTNAILADVAYLLVAVFIACARFGPWSFTG
jgi:hypothetical protein